VQRHGGSVACHSAPGAGARFTVHVPHSAAADATHCLTA